MAVEKPCPSSPTLPDRGPEAALAAWLVELSCGLMPGSAAPRVGGPVLVVGTRAARAVQGLALQRAFCELRDPVSRIRLVQLIEAMLAAEKAHPG